MRITIERTYQEKATPGDAVVYRGIIRAYQFKTLELPWNGNKRNISCIPEGTYMAIKHVSPKFGPCLWLPDVPGRSEILVHPGNFTREIRGCILPGRQHADIDGDGIIDVTRSREAMAELMRIVPNELWVTIKPSRASA